MNEDNYTSKEAVVDANSSSSMFICLFQSLSVYPPLVSNMSDFRLQPDQATKISQPISYDNRSNPSPFPRSTSASPFQHQRARGRRRLTGALSRLRLPTRTRERGKVTEGLERSPRRAVRPSGRCVTGVEGRGPLLRPGILAGWKRPVNAPIYLRLEPRRIGKT